MKFTISKCTLQFFVCTYKVVQHHHYPIPEHFHHSKRNPMHLLAAIPYSFFLPAPSNHNLIYVDKDLPVLNITYNWYHTICALLSLASFTYLTILKLYPCCSMHCSLLPSWGWITFHILFIHPSLVKHLCCSYFLAIGNNIVVTFVCKLFCKYVFSILLGILINKFCWPLKSIKFWFH